MIIIVKTMVAYDIMSCQIQALVEKKHNSINTWHVGLIKRNTNIHFHFLSFLKIKMIMFCL